MNATPRQRQTLKRDLEIMAFNANGAFDKQPELVEFVARHKPDVLLLAETHLTPCRRFRLPNYVCYREDRIDRQRGGTAVLVKASIRHHRVGLPQRQHLKCTAVLGALGAILAASAYRPPQQELLSQDLDTVFGAHRRMVMAGDLNCKHSDWGSRLCNRSGKRLRRYAETARVTVISPAKPTYYPPRPNARPDVLDVAAIKGICCPVHVSPINELSSDHCPISVNAAIQHPMARYERRVIQWDRFGPAFCRRIPEQVPLDTTQHIDEATALFDTAVVPAMESVADMTPQFTTHWQRIPDEIGPLASERNRLRRHCQRGRDLADRAAFNRASGS